MRNAAVKIKTNGETIPKARNENKTGSAKPSIFVEVRVAHQAIQAATSPTATAIIRLPSATCSRVWQCGHSRPSENAITRPAGTVFPQCGHIRLATIHLAKKAHQDIAIGCAGKARNHITRANSTRWRMGSMRSARTRTRSPSFQTRVCPPLPQTMA